MLPEAQVGFDAVVLRGGTQYVVQFPDQNKSSATTNNVRPSVGDARTDLDDENHVDQ